MPVTPITQDEAFAALLEDVAAARAPTATLRAGQRLGDVVLERPLGRGGMGEVWEGRDIRTGRAVALKLLHRRGLVGSPDEALNEAAILERVRHPHIVEVHNFGVHDGETPFVVMERLGGETLAERVRRRGPMTPFDAIPLAEQLGAALGHAHTHGLIQRDVKPSNIIVEEKGPELLVKLIDFGLTRPTPRLDDEAASLRPAGTPAYMSPEQRTDPKRVDGRSDLWSASAVLHFALTGADPAGPAAPKLPESVGRWLDRGMAATPEQRPATAHQWAQGFKRAVARGGPALPYPEALYAEPPVPRPRPQPAPPTAASSRVIPRVWWLALILASLALTLAWLLR
ncbi:MAG: serine/threonine-protein kinase [Myxococcota bacterium]